MLCRIVALFPYPLAPKLPAVEQILPQDVRAGAEGREWCQIGVGHPDSEYSVLLSKSLPTADAVVVVSANQFAQKELDDACGKSGSADGQ